MTAASLRRSLARLTMMSVAAFGACSNVPPPEFDAATIGTGAALETTICPDKKYVRVNNHSTTSIDVAAQFPYDRRLIPLGQVGADKSDEFEMPKGTDRVDYRATNVERRTVPNGVELRFSCGPPPDMDG